MSPLRGFFIITHMKTPHKRGLYYVLIVTTAVQNAKKQDPIKRYNDALFVASMFC